MSLIALKQYLMQVRMTSLANLCLVFHADAARVRCMLEHWIVKGKVRRCMQTPRCGSSCGKCPVANVEWYEWVSG